MYCLIPFFAGDKDQAVRLAGWIRDLGGVNNHDTLLVVDKSTTPEGVYEPLSEAFRSVKVTASAPVGSQGTWGTGTTDATAANEMWITGANYVFHKLKVPFVWLEPDAAPTRSSWLDEIDAEYLAAKKPFMGMLVDMPPHERHMSGVGCYPFDVANHSLAMLVPGPIAWDYAGRKDTVGKGKAHFTDLIQHFYRINGQTPEWPTFPTLESLSQINPRAAVFHRCKDSSLIDRLREKHFGRLENMLVELPASAACADIVAQGSNPDLTFCKDYVHGLIFQRDDLLARIVELEAQLADRLGTKPKSTSKKTRTTYVKRTAAEQDAINARMAKARAARKV